MFSLLCITFNHSITIIAYTSTITDRQTDREIETERDRETDRDRETYREREFNKSLW